MLHLVLFGQLVVDAPRIECPRLWRITKHSLHIFYMEDQNNQLLLLCFLQSAEESSLKYLVAIEKILACCLRSVLCYATTLDTLTKNPAFVLAYCKKSCNVCGGEFFFIPYRNINNNYVETQNPDFFCLLFVLLEK